jgi:hypothetical protein
MAISYIQRVFFPKHQWVDLRNAGALHVQQNKLRACFEFHPEAAEILTGSQVRRLAARCWTALRTLRSAVHSIPFIELAGMTGLARRGSHPVEPFPPLEGPVTFPPRRRVAFANEIIPAAAGVRACLFRVFPGNRPDGIASCRADWVGV